MGAGIAQVAAQIAKIPQVILFDQNQNQIDCQMRNLMESLSKARSKGTLTEEDEHFTMTAIKPCTKLTDLEGSDFVIEVGQIVVQKLLYIYLVLGRKRGLKYKNQCNQIIKCASSTHQHLGFKHFKYQYY